jgi:hypothetical protein
MKKVSLTLLVSLFCIFQLSAQIDLGESKALIKRIIPTRANAFEVGYLPQENGKMFLKSVRKTAKLSLKEVQA